MMQNILLLIFSSSLLYLIEPLCKYGILLGLILITFFALILNLKRISLNIKFVIVYSLYIISSLVAALWNSDIELLISTIFMIILFINLTIIVPSIFGSKKNNVLVNKTVLLTHIPVIFIPLIYGGIDSIPYKGLFINSNSFGTTIVMLFSVCVARIVVMVDNYFIGKKINVTRIKLFCLLISIGILFLLCIYSGSRNSTITSVLIILVAFSPLVLKYFRNCTNKQIFKGIKMFIFVIGIIGIIVFMTPIVDMFNDVIVYKFQVKSDRGDVLDSRGDIWSETIEDAHLFGNGRNYFFETAAQIAPHNTYISLLGQYGWATLITFIFLLIMGLKYALCYCMNALDDELRFLPLTILTSFILLSIAEGMMLKVNMLGSFSLFGTISIYRTKKNVGLP